MRLLNRFLNSKITIVWLTLITTIVAILSFLLFVYVSRPVEATIEAKVRKFSRPRLLLYAGEITNISDNHAENVSLSARFSNARVFDLTAIATDVVNYKNVSSDGTNAEFVLNRLSKKSDCAFDIFAEPQGEVVEHFAVSWGRNGKMEIIPQLASMRESRDVTLGENLRKREEELTKRNAGSKARKMKEGDLSREARSQDIRRDSRSVR